MKRTIGLTKAKKELERLVDGVIRNDDEIIITKYGKRKVIILSPEKWRNMRRIKIWKTEHKFTE